MFINIIHFFFFFREEKQFIKLPFNIKDAQNLGKVLEHYKDTYYTQVFLSISFCYILYPLNTLKFNYDIAHFINTNFTLTIIIELACKPLQYLVQFHYQYYAVFYTHFY